MSLIEGQENVPRFQAISELRAALVESGGRFMNAWRHRAALATILGSSPSKVALCRVMDKQTEVVLTMAAVFLIGAALVCGLMCLGAYHAQ